MKVNVGCGQDRKAGYKNVDIKPGAHVQAPAWDLPFEDGSAEEVYSRMLLEHMRPPEAGRALAEWFRVLQPGGRLHVIVPDLPYHLRQFFMAGQSECARAGVSSREHAMAGIYGVAHGPMQHCWGYTRDTLRAAVEHAGFVDVAFVDELPCNIDLRAMRP